MDVDEYAPADPTLQAWHKGVAELRLDGELRAYLTGVVGEIRWPVRGPWLWYRVVWPDGFMEYPQEDYGPGRDVVRELDGGASRTPRVRAPSIGRGSSASTWGSGAAPARTR